MTELETARTLVKSTPELWAACSDPDTLGKHLQAFGEIKITRLEPETTVAWEGESASGTVVLEPSGWGTKVTLKAAAMAVEREAAVEAEPVVETVPVPELHVVPVKARSGGMLGWVRGLLGHAEPVAVAPEPVAASKPVAVLETPVADVEEPELPDALGALEAALDSLGQAHHRPFSRG